MELIHKLGKNSIKKAVDGLDSESLMLAKDGSYLWIGQESASRYQGWFFGIGGDKILKIIEHAGIRHPGGLTALENNFWNVKRIGKENSETFFLPGNDCFAYELEEPAEIEFLLDVRETYKNPEFGRHYKVWSEGDVLFVNYRQENDFLLPEIFIAVAGDISALDIKNEWLCRDYPLDRARGSAPWERWVFKPAVLRASKLVFAVGFNKDETGSAAVGYWRDFEKIKRLKSQSCGNGVPARNLFAFDSKNKAAENERMMARQCAQNSLAMLGAASAGLPGLRAGLPWFFQFWPRDEAVSLKELDRIDEAMALNIFWRQMNDLPAGSFDRDSGDWPGWLFLRASEFFQRGRLNIKQAAAVGVRLENEIDFLLEKRTKNNLALNGDGKTWMDAIGRGGAAIEIQALRLNMYSLAADLAGNKKQKNRYLELEDGLAKTVRELFFDGSRLADVYNPETNGADFTARPNIFLAAYIYPRLLSRREWIICFEAALEKLWLDWGGLATIDINNPMFHCRDTGQDPSAYHNGDSWFWVNNIAAIVMARADRKKFKDYINGIFEAGKNDILWNGAVGCASEISPALDYAPAGCANQAWSNATFLELLDELK